MYVILRKNPKVQGFLKYGRFQTIDAVETHIEEEKRNDKELETFEYKILWQDEETDSEESGFNFRAGTI